MNTNTRRKKFEDCPHANWVLAGKKTPQGGFDISYQNTQRLQVFCKDCETYVDLGTKEKLNPKDLTTFRETIIENYKMDMEGK